jgi:hypothetical protein
MISGRGSDTLAIEPVNGLGPLAGTDPVGILALTLLIAILTIDRLSRAR